VLRHWEAGLEPVVNAFRGGFEDALGPHWERTLATFTMDELEQQLCGDRLSAFSPEFWDMDGVRNCILPNFEYTTKSDQYIWLTEILASPSHSCGEGQGSRSDTGTMDLDRATGSADLNPQQQPDGPPCCPPQGRSGGARRVLSPTQRSKFLQFVTGCPVLPLGGLAALQPKITVDRASTTSAVVPASDMLPTARTCTSCLRLPPYTSKEELFNKMVIALEHNSSFQLS